MESDMERVKRLLARDLWAGVAERGLRGVAWLVDVAAEIMATLTGDELDALVQGELRPSAYALEALAERDNADQDDEGDATDEDDETDVAGATEEGRNIARYFDCTQCINADEPSWLSVGAWADGLHVEVWCARHATSLIVVQLAHPLFASLPSCDGSEHHEPERQQ
jgi:hypothetical protein